MPEKRLAFTHRCAKTSRIGERERIPEKWLVFTHRRAYNVRIVALGLVVSLHALCKCVRGRTRERRDGGGREGEQMRERARERASERARER